MAGASQYFHMIMTMKVGKNLMSLMKKEMSPNFRSLVGFLLHLKNSKKWADLRNTFPVILNIKVNGIYVEKVECKYCKQHFNGATIRGTSHPR